MNHKDKPVLYVDDTEEQRYAMCRILEREGYRPIEARTGAEAFAALGPEILVIVLDVKLPDISGYEVCRRIKADPVYGHLPIIQVSASFADPDHRAVGLSGGADAYIAQPVHPQELLNLVRSVIRSSQAEQMLSFMAEIAPKISRSLDLAETKQAVEASVPPYFADVCELALPELQTDPEEGVPALHPKAAFMDLVLQRGTPQLELLTDGSSSIGVPLRHAGESLGVALFMLHGRERTYAEADLLAAADLSERIALALDNARLYTAQRTAQEALIQSEKLAAAGRLSAAIAHELNNPLEAITNLLFLIETDPEISGTARNYAREALSELERLSHITRQSLGFYRELTTAQTFDVAENVKETLSLYSRRLTAKGITVEEEYSVGLAVRAIRGEIRQVLSNLIVNALDAMGFGGRLSVRTNLSEENEVTIAVHDTGPGIPPKLQARIFEPFFTTKPGTGTGLGLWVSDNIMRKHGGRLEVESGSESAVAGTTMRMVLPASGD